LTELSKASREVTQATANVVATAKSCNHLVEENGTWFENIFNHIILHAMPLINAIF